MPRLTQPPTLHERWRASIGDHVQSLVWSPDGKRLAAASISGPITLFDAASGTVLHSLTGHGFGTAALAWRPKGDLLASAGQDGKVRLWNVHTGEEVRSLDGGSTWVEYIVWDRRGERLVSAAGKKLRLWDKAGELLRAYPDQPHSIGAVAWDLKGRELISAGFGGVRFWSTDADEPVREIEERSAFLVLALSPEGKDLAAGSQDASVHFWQIRTGKHLAMTGYPTKVRELAWESTGRYLATGGGPRVIVWDCSGKGPQDSTPISLERHERPINALAFQHAGSLLASVAGDGWLLLWQPGTVKRPLAEASSPNGLVQVAWAPSDARLAVGTEEGSVAVYRI